MFPLMGNGSFCDIACYKSTINLLNSESRYRSSDKHYWSKMSSASMDYNTLSSNVYAHQKTRERSLKSKRIHVIIIIMEQNNRSKPL
jgi:hypothetical protein